VSELTHIDAQGRAHMVDVGDKDITVREAIAVGRVEMAASTLDLILTGGAKKGDVLGVARLAGIMGAKRTADLIPLCHPIGLNQVTVEFKGVPGDTGTLWVRATARCDGRTGVEMEAMTAVTVACLTVYDMCKAADRGMTVGGVQLWRKTGGKSGLWQRDGALPSGDWV
jgi:cyclic pyranopterin monophosphate synthase